MREGYCPTRSSGWGALSVRRDGEGARGQVGEKFEFLLNSVTITGIVTKGYFDKCMGPRTEHCCLHGDYTVCSRGY